MAQLLAPSPPIPGASGGRISQMLPNVTCSSCGAPVPLTELSGHICAGAQSQPLRSGRRPAVAPSRTATQPPSTPSKQNTFPSLGMPPMRNASAPQVHSPGPRAQTPLGRVPPSPGPPPQGRSPPSPGFNSPPPRPSEAFGQHTPRQPGFTSPLVLGGLLGNLPQIPFPVSPRGGGQRGAGGLPLPQPGFRRERSTSNASAGAGPPSPPMAPPQPAFSSRNRSQSNASQRRLRANVMDESEGSRDFSPSDDLPLPRPSFSQRERSNSSSSGRSGRGYDLPRSGSPASLRSAPPPRSPVPHPPGSPAPSFRRLQQPSSKPEEPSGRARTPSDRQLPTQMDSFSRAHTPSERHPSPQPPLTSVNFPQEHLDWPAQPASLSQRSLDRERRPPAINLLATERFPVQATNGLMGAPPPASSFGSRSPLPPNPPSTPRTPALPSAVVQSPDPDTHVGGAAGMAGVGRRGYFAALAATTLASNLSVSGSGSENRSMQAPTSPSFDVLAAPFMQRQRTGSNASGSAMRNTSAPPQRDVPPARRPDLDTPPLSPTPSPISDPQSPLRTPSPTRSNMTGPERMPFFDKFKNKNSSSTSFDRTRESHATDSDFGGLAYDESENGSGSLSKSSSSATRKSDKLYTSGKEVQSGSDDHLSPVVRVGSVSSASSSYSQANTRFTARSAGALASALDALQEEVRFPPLPLRDSDQDKKQGKEKDREESISPKLKLPTRSRTTGGGGFVVDVYGRPTRDSALGRTGLSPSLSTREVRSREKELETDVARQRELTQEKMMGTRRLKACLRCEKRIEDGKWIRSEAGVLCEQCWKSMYLPKCRRCDLPIEKQAVSSSDGQLKGKYHKACFNCHTCQEPFPDKSFYVHDGRPYCAYHYHKANNSLCAAPDCGQPIEGPCAVSYSGERFHPAHFVCEHEGCFVRLADEYYEVDGRMMCERHASVARNDRYSDDFDERYRFSAAQKRRTRFIDIGGLGVNGLH